jgi:membrane protease YdiL (CAAX protease family)
VNRYVDRFGKTGFAALTSLIWAVPMAAWAGSSDLSPVDKTAYPWVALSIGLVMLAVWLVLLTRLGKIPVTPRQRRLDIAQMSKSERRWTLALIAFGAGLIAWLNAAATVDWAPLGGALRSGSSGAVLFTSALATYLLVMIAGVLITWRKARLAFQKRKAGAIPPPPLPHPHQRE